jgi:hypothetical protein
MSRSVKVLAPTGRVMPKSMIRGAVGGHDDVAWLEVAVHQAAAVDRDEPLGQRGPQGRCRRHGKGAILPDRRVQRRSRDERGDHPRLAGIRIGVDHVRGVEPAHGPCRLHLAGEAPPVLRVLDDLGPDHLDRDQSPARRGTQVDLAHPARAEPAQQAVVAYLARVSSL